jgi:hypothetical protein
MLDGGFGLQVGHHHSHRSRGRAFTAASIQPAAVSVLRAAAESGASKRWAVPQRSHEPWKQPAGASESMGACASTTERGRNGLRSAGVRPRHRPRAANRAAHARLPSAHCGMLGVRVRRHVNGKGLRPRERPSGAVDAIEPCRSGSASHRPSRATPRSRSADAFLRARLGARGRPPGPCRTRARRSRPRRREG